MPRVPVIPLLLIITIIIINTVTGFFISNAIHNRRHLCQSISDDDGDDDITNSLLLKYPIIQVYLNAELKTELFCDNDVNLFVKKVKSYLTQIDHDINNNHDYDNDDKKLYHYIYSDDQLKQELETSKAIIVLKLFRHNCIRCTAFDEYYYESTIADKSSRYRWIQADISNIPMFVTALKLRLQGNVEGSSNVIDNCTMCKNSGFTLCSTCDGRGLVTRGSNTVFCPTCVGYKKIRCQTCGGKCIRCAV